nr:putative ribonuclease H-like domain-containing protein [Tanacetum cinerariifolium]
AKVKTVLGYHSQFNEKEVVDVKEEEVTETVFDNRSSDEENSLANDRPEPIPAKIAFVKTGESVKHGKQYKTTCKTKLASSISQPLQMLHMDLFGPTSIMSINHKKYCLVVTDDFSRFSWVFFLATKDETSKVLKPFITAIENQINKNLKVIRCDNGKDFKNRDLNEFYKMKGIKKEYSYARTPQQNKVVERKNRTLIEAAMTMLVDSLLPITFWVEAVNTACYVLNRALVTKTHNKTPYELLNCRSPRLDFMRPFGSFVTILNTLDLLGKFEGKADEGFLVWYSVTSKAFRVFNTKTRKVKENLHVRFLKNKPNIEGSIPNWLFDIDSLTNSMIYIPVFAGNQTNKYAGPQDTNGNAGTQDNVDTRTEVSDQHHIMLPLWSSTSSTYKSSDDKAADDKPKDDIGPKTEASDAEDALRKEFEKECMDQRRGTKAGSTNSFNTISNPVNAASTSEAFSAGGPSSPHFNEFIHAITLLHVDQDDSQIPNLEDTTKLRKADFNNMESSTIVSLIPTHRVHIAHPKDQILGDPKLAAQTRGMAKKYSRAHAFMEPKKKVWRLVDLPYEKKAIGTKWVYENKKYKRGIVIRNKARLVEQGHKQEEGIDYGEVFAPVARIEAIRIFLAFASFMGFIVYQMDVKSAFLYDTIEEKVTPKLSHLHVVKQIFRYLKGQPKLGVWYPRDSPFDLEAYSNSDYAGANLDKKSTTGAC